MEQENQKGFILPIVGIIILILVVGAGVYYLGTKNSKRGQTQPVTTSQDNPQPTQSVDEAPTATNSQPILTPSPKNETTNWHTHTNTLMGYKILYPPTWEVQYKDYSQQMGFPTDDLIIKDLQSNSVLDITGNGQRSGCRDDTPQAQTDCHEVVTTFQTTSGLTGYKAAFDQSKPTIINQYTFRTGKNKDFGRNYVEIRPGLSDPQLSIEQQIISTVSEL